MDHAERTLETAVYAMAEGIATRDQIALLEADTRAWRLMLERLIDDTEDQLEDVRRIQGPERDQVVADFTQELARLDASYDLLTKVTDPLAVIAGADPGGEVRLQASWEAGKIVVWGAGPGTAPESNDELADRLEAIGGPKLGWTLHADVPLAVGGPRRGGRHPRAGVAGLARGRRRGARTRWRRGQRGVARTGGRWPPCAWSRRARSCPR